MFMNSKGNNQPTHENFSERQEDTETRVSAKSIKMIGSTCTQRVNKSNITHLMPVGP